MDGATRCSYAYYYLDDVCVSTDSLTCNGAIGIETYNSKDRGFCFYPNPAQSVAFCEIALNSNESGFVQIFNMLGDQITKQQLSPGFNKVGFDLSGLSDGMYMYRLIINAEIRANKKLIITK